MAVVTMAGDAMRGIMTAFVAMLLVAGCATAQVAPTPSTPATPTIVEPPAVSLPSVPGSSSADASPDPRAALIDEAATRWAAGRPPSYAFVFTHLGPGGTGWDWRHRVVSLEGRVQSQWLGGLAQARADAVDRMTVDGLFSTARWALGAQGQTQMTFDPALGYPTRIDHHDESPSDGSWTETATEFASSLDPDRAPRLREVIDEARAAWKRWAAGDFAYTWRRFAASAGPWTGTAWLVQSSAGQVTSESGPASDGALPADAASVASTFDTVEAALDAGAWVDLTVDATSGLPLLVAVDPVPSATGDGYWMAITFRDMEGEVATSALEAAKTRWAAAGLQRFSYTWRYRGALAPLTYHVVMEGEVSHLRRDPGTPVPEARSYAAPRIDDSFRMIEEVLAEGGHVRATYDPVLGYPLRVEVDPLGWAGAKGVITISDFAIP